MPVVPATTVNVRYMVHDVDAAIEWYTTRLYVPNASLAFADVMLGLFRAD
jgi:hypothetical protein